MIPPHILIKLMLETIKQWYGEANAESSLGTMKDLQISFIIKLGIRMTNSKKQVWVGLPQYGVCN